MPMREVQELVSDEKRSCREVREESRLARKYMWVVTKSEKRKSLPSQPKSGGQVGEDDATRVEYEEEVREMGF